MTKIENLTKTIDYMNSVGEIPFENSIWRKIQNSFHKFPDISRCSLHVPIILISFHGNSGFPILYKAWFFRAN